MGACVKSETVDWPEQFDRAMEKLGVRGLARHLGISTNGVYWRRDGKVEPSYSEALKVLKLNGFHVEHP